MSSLCILMISLSSCLCTYCNSYTPDLTLLYWHTALLQLYSHQPAEHTHRKTLVRHCSMLLVYCDTACTLLSDFVSTITIETASDTTTTVYAIRQRFFAIVIVMIIISIHITSSQSLKLHNVSVYKYVPPEVTCLHHHLATL
jgi:hypothetical protein